MKIVLYRNLVLMLGKFYMKDPGHWYKCRVGVGTSSMKLTAISTITNPESHAHLAFASVLRYVGTVGDFGI